MVADPGRFYPTNPRSGQFARPKVESHSAAQPRKEERSSASRTAAEFPAAATDRAPLLEYAAFVLDQEAKYCQL